MCDSVYLKDGWKYFFYFSSAFTVLGLVISWIFIYDTPDSHPWIEDEEKNYIEETAAKSTQTPSEKLRVIFVYFDHS